MHRAALVMLLVVAALIAVGCGGGEDDDSGPAPLATPDAVRTTIWERSFSECSSEPLKRLAAKYHVDPVEAKVVQAVGKEWTERFDGGADALRYGRDGCRQGLSTQ